MNPPITGFDELEVGLMYDLYQELPEDDSGFEWSTLPAQSVRFLGIGDVYGDPIAVFQGPDLPDQENLGAITLVREEDLNGLTALLPFDPVDHGLPPDGSQRIDHGHNG